MSIRSVSIENFKSIKNSGVVELGPLNVLIGANGAGKSNFISFFKFLNKLYEQQLQLYVAQNGRADNFLFFGRKISDFLYGKIIFDGPFPENEYMLMMRPDQAGNLIFVHEFMGDRGLNSGGSESKLPSESVHGAKNLLNNLSSFKLFHFQDTSFNAAMRNYCNTIDYAYLHEDGGNIAAFLYRLQKSHPNKFKMIEYTVKSIAPFFDRFFLEPDEINPNQIFLRWLEKGYDQMFNAHNFSDGTLRMICLTALLLQPNPPNTIIIDEPELGLHPFAIHKLASMIQMASHTSQIIISTESVNLLNYFKASDVIVVDRKDNQTIFTRQDEAKLEVWLEDYSLGELWEKNVMGGRP